MIGCLRTRVHKQPIVALYFESETVLKFYNLEAWGNFCSCFHYSLLGILSGPDAFMEIKVLHQLLCPVDMYIKCLDIWVGTLAK